MPRSLARALRSAGFDIAEVRDAPLRGSSDQAVFEHAQAQGYVLVTGDVGLGDVVRFPGARHRGIVVSRFPNEVSNDVVNDAILAAIRSLTEQELAGRILIVEPGRVRLRKG